jgi:hypothetical protein
MALRAKVVVLPSIFLYNFRHRSFERLQILLNMSAYEEVSALVTTLAEIQSLSLHRVPFLLTRVCPSNQLSTVNGMSMARF